MNHEYSIEVLYHFNCGVCKNWWSYATTPAPHFIKDLELPKVLITTVHIVEQMKLQK